MKWNAKSGFNLNVQLVYIYFFHGFSVIGFCRRLYRKSKLVNTKFSSVYRDKQFGSISTKWCCIQDS